ncbi:hypothetical protein [Mycobacterium sp. DL592]|uniref:hypothetical protein n=1 Tax=Mycobacterium sp. DL592 TaxID=2675524 RepID=UPI00141FD944|nr:hypothetical protein [Mycobacterium sp. DL592]
MTAGDQPPDVDDLARSMMELLGVHEHDEPHPADDESTPTSWAKAPDFAGDPQRAAALHEATRLDRERYLSAGLAEVDCRFCHVSVRVKKLGAAHTLVQWNTEAQQRCAYFAEVRAAGGSSARTRGCQKMSDSIKHAVAEGCLEEYSSAPAPGDG